jgi:hypothetical protein
MNVLGILNLAGLSFLMGWMLSRHMSEKEIDYLRYWCLHYYRESKQLNSKEKD